MVRWRKPRVPLFRLTAWWNPKERDTYVELTPRQTSADMHWLLDIVLNKAALSELAERGYDLSTLRFSIDKTPEAIADHFQRCPNSPYKEPWEQQRKKGER